MPEALLDYKLLAEHRTREPIMNDGMQDNHWSIAKRRRVNLPEIWKYVLRANIEIEFIFQPRKQSTYNFQ